MRTINLPDDVASAVYLALEQSTDGAAAPVAPVVTPKFSAPTPPVQVAPARDRWVEGAKIRDWVYGPNGGAGANMIDQMADFYVAHPELGPNDYDKLYDRVVTKHEGRTGTDLANAIGQDRRDESAQVSGVDFAGEVPIEEMRPFNQHINDGLYLATMFGQWAAMVGGGTIWQAMLRGSANDVNAFIQFIGSTNAGSMATFNAGSYTGRFKGLVEQRMR